MASASTFTSAAPRESSTGSSVEAAGPSGRAAGAALSHTAKSELDRRRASTGSRARRWTSARPTRIKSSLTLFSSRVP